MSNKSILAEFMGTFGVILFGCGSVVGGMSQGAFDLSGVALAFGFALFAMIMAFRPVSGAHFNPVVSLTMLTLGKMKAMEFTWYLIAQFAGALLATYVLHFLFPGDSTSLGATIPATENWIAFMLELLMTFTLMFVILQASSNKDNSLLAVALTVSGTLIMMILMGGSSTGTSVNPFRTLGPALVSGNFTGLWIYLTAPFAGGLIAGVVHKAFR